MADVTRMLTLRHLRADPTAHVRHWRRGRLAHDGAGVAFWYLPRQAALTEVPLDDHERPLLFHARTRDFQDVTVQLTVTYRIVDPAVAATRLDFAIDPQTGRWRSQPLDQLGDLLTELSQQHTLGLIGSLTLLDALADGMTAVRRHVATGLAADARLAETGVEVVDVRVVAVRAEAELERALQTTAREQIQQQADRATYERRAEAVARERAIAENELANQIELARREEDLVDRRGQNERRRAEQAAVAARIAAHGKAATQRVLADAEADATRTVGEASAAAQAARVDAHRDADPATLLSLALSDLAGQLPAIGTLTVTPDLLSGVLARLGAVPTAQSS